MKTKHRNHVCLFFSLLTPLAAQNFPENNAVRSAGSSAEVVSSERAVASPGESPAVVTSQDSITLEPQLRHHRDVNSVIDLAVLEKPSAFRNLAVGKPAAVSAEVMKQDLALISATYREIGRPESNCESISLSVEQGIRLDESRLLEIVETEVKANPGCSCEVVKTAIKASEADVGKVVSIVETSITAAPEMMRIVSQCAIAAMPESLAGVQALMAKYDANSGDAGPSAKSAKSSKDAKASPAEEVAANPNPLDFPGNGPVGPTLQGQGGQPLIPPTPPIIIHPPQITEVDP